jgi:hypothetical protein
MCTKCTATACVLAWSILAADLHTHDISIQVGKEGCQQSILQVHVAYGGNLQQQVVGWVLL